MNFTAFFHLFQSIQKAQKSNSDFCALFFDVSRPALP